MSGMEEESARKKPAFTGQWLTPPLPVFPTSASGSTTTGSAAAGATAAAPTSTNGAGTDASKGNEATTVAGANIPVELPPVSELPDSTEDYAKALQEAYRRGAEAAAAMASSQQGGMLSGAVSCPDFQVDRMSISGSSTSPVPSSGSPVPPAAAMQTQHAPSSNVPIIPPPIPNPLSSPSAIEAMPPPPPPPQHTQAPTVSSTTSVPGVARQHRSTPPVPPPAPTSSSAAASRAQQRSMSLPDMASYGAQQEEEKRQKRLARNRASARLRRLRKKNLVDAYETEVGILEKTLQQLKAHDWGAEDNPRALTEALSMDRGQQVLTAEERKQAATDILEQQLQYIEMLEEVMQEQYILIHLNDSPELADLKEVLQLSESQLQQLSTSASGWEEEWNALQTVKASLRAMKENNFLWNEGCMAIADDFMQILHKNQVSKFLLWADHNVEAIDELDGVNAPGNVPEGPLFSFGVNSNPDSLLEEEKV